uniref:Uncharacterized protein n=1 Tax=Cacopsylla melanoneura TaxID=428564 RepID=A0A8D8UWQ8_9HEMI
MSTFSIFLKHISETKTSVLNSVLSSDSGSEVFVFRVRYLSYLILKSVVKHKHQSRNSIIAVLPITVETLLEDITRVIDRPETRNGRHHFILRRQSIRVDSYQEYSRERRELISPLLEDLKNNVTSHQRPLSTGTYTYMCANLYIMYLGQDHLGTKKYNNMAKKQT